MSMRLRSLQKKAVMTNENCDSYCRCFVMPVAWLCNWTSAMTTIAKLMPDYNVEIIEYDGDTLWKELDSDEYPTLDLEEWDDWAEDHGFSIQGTLIFKPTATPIEAGDGWNEAVREELQYGVSGIWKWGTLLSIDVVGWEQDWPYLEIESLP